MHGTVKKFFRERRYGFIQRDEGGEDILFHSNLVRGREALRAGQEVVFDATRTARGWRASVVIPATGRVRSRRRNSYRSTRSPYFVYGASAGSAVALVAAMLVLIVKVPFLWAHLVAVNAVTFVLYAFDKAIAGTGTMRCPEVVLHAGALLGGTPAAFAAQKLVRHKTIKDGFQVTFGAIAVFQFVLLVWLAY